MLIRCKANVATREVTFPNSRDPRDLTVYAFAKNAAGDLVCEVPVTAHSDRLVNDIPEMFEVYAADTVTPVDVREEGLSVEVGDGVQTLTGPDYNGLTRKQLEAAYEEKFGKPPHPRAKDSTILAKLTDG